MNKCSSGMMEHHAQIMRMFLQLCPLGISCLNIFFSCPQTSPAGGLIVQVQIGNKPCYQIHVNPGYRFDEEFTT